MPNFLESKNTLIVPLSLFIKINEKNATEKLLTLFGAMVTAHPSNPKENKNLAYFKKQQQEFNENSVKKILNSQLVTDFNLGNKNKSEFISELLSSLKLPHNHFSDVEEAWDSLIEFDLQSSAVFEALIKLTYQGKSIYFIGDTNELHAKKSLEFFSLFPFNKLSFLENLPEANALPFVISHSRPTPDALTSPKGRVYFCLSYTYKTLLTPPPSLLSQFFRLKPTPDLLTHLNQYLTNIGKTKNDILFVNPYSKEQFLAKKLALEIISKEDFSINLLSESTHTATVNYDPNPDKTQADEASIQEGSEIEFSSNHLSMSLKAH